MLKKLYLKKNDYKAVLFLDYSYFKPQVYSHKFK